VITFYIEQFSNSDMFKGRTVPWIYVAYEPRSRDSAVGIATGCGLDDRGVGV
jgi:hypothetical protein